MMAEDNVSLCSTCVLCCKPIHVSNSSDEFLSFCREIKGFDEGVGAISKLESVLLLRDIENVWVCSRCEKFVGEAMEVKGRVEEVEGRVRKLQNEVLMALKDLFKVLGEYQEQLKKIEVVVRESSNAEELALSQTDAISGVGSTLSELREAIIKEPRNVEIHRNSLSAKLMCKTGEEVEVKVEPGDGMDFGSVEGTFSPSSTKCELEDGFKREDATPREVRARKRRLGISNNGGVTTAKVKKEKTSPRKGVKMGSKKKRKRLFSSKSKPKKKYLPAPPRQVYLKEQYFCNLCPDLKLRSTYALEDHLRSVHETPEKPLKCDLCSAQFSCEQYLKLHAKFHRGNYQRKCDLCPTPTFINPTDLLSHLKSHGGEIPLFQCSKCSFVCAIRKRYLRHLTKHSSNKLHGGGQFPCDRCSQTFSTYTRLIGHLKNEHDEEVEEFFCGIDNCARSFFAFESLQNHQKSHSNTGHVCTKCYQGYSSRKELFEHKKNVHDEGNPCHLCSQRFDGQQALDSHLVKVHDAPKFKCDQCDKEYSDRNQLNLHKKLHTSTCFPCEHCGKVYTSESLLRKHYVAHKNDRIFTCEQCGMSFKYKWNLKKHMTTHDDKRERFPCDHCQKTFTRPENLKVHLRIHRGERPYVCDLCGKGFNQSGAFNLHKRTIHKKSREEKS